MCGARYVWRTKQCCLSVKPWHNSRRESIREAASCCSRTGETRHGHSTAHASNRPPSSPIKNPTSASMELACIACHCGRAASTYRMARLAMPSMAAATSGATSDRMTVASGRSHSRCIAALSFASSSATRPGQRQGRNTLSVRRRCQGCCTECGRASSMAIVAYPFSQACSVLVELTFGAARDRCTGGAVRRRTGEARESVALLLCRVLRLAADEAQGAKDEAALADERDAGEEAHVRRRRLRQDGSQPARPSRHVAWSRNGEGGLVSRARLPPRGGQEGGVSGKVESWPESCSGFDCQLAAWRGIELAAELDG